MVPGSIFVLVILFLQISTIQIADGIGQRKLAPQTKARILYDYALLRQDYCALRASHSQRMRDGTAEYELPSHRSVKLMRDNFLKYGDLKCHSGGARNKSTKVTPELIAEIRRLINNGSNPLSVTVIAKEPTVNVWTEKEEEKMQSHERQLLQSNINQLARAINFAEVSQLLLIGKTFNEPMIDHIKSYQDDHFRKLILLTDLQTRGPNAFIKFVEILELTGCIEALRIISPGSLVKQGHKPSSSFRTAKLNFFQLKADSNGRREVNNIDNEHQGIDAYDKPHRPQTLLTQQDQLPQDDVQQRVFNWHPFSATTKSKDSSCSLTPSDISISLGQESTTQPAVTSSQSNYDMAINFMNAENNIVVKKAIVCHENPREDYKFTSRPRGPCLIINNVDFDFDSLPHRKGSDGDARMLLDVFHQLGFEVHHERNLTANAMKKTFSKLVSACRAEHDALFMIILSHGSDSGIFGTDGIEVDLNDIMSYFDNKRCKIMIGKPKVFIIQSCKGRISNYLSSEDSTDSAACSPESPSEMHSSFSTEQPLVSSRGSESARNLGIHAIRTDMLLCFSCVPGYASVQDDSDLGPGLSKVLAYYLMTSAWNKDFQRILAIVCRDIERQTSSGGYTEAVEINCLGWSKYLYLNPGIYR